MNREILDITDYTILLEEATSTTNVIDTCNFDEPVIAVAFYGAGNVGLTVNFNDSSKHFEHTKGMVLAFYADEHVSFEHHVSSDKPLQCLVIATTLRNIDALPNGETPFLEKFLAPLVNAQDHFIEGPLFFMNPEMYHLVNQFFNNTHTGSLKMMFYKSYISALLAHFFGELAIQETKAIKPTQLTKILKAQEILLADLENPPSLTDLANQIGINTSKLKRDFKAQFGVPVFKYLQNERLNKAHTLIQEKQHTIQEAAWAVGYDSLGSFSNAFEKKFGYRPSQIS